MVDFREYTCLNAEKRKRYIQEVVNRCALQGAEEWISLKELGLVDQSIYRVI